MKDLLGTVLHINTLYFSEDDFYAIQHLLQMLQTRGMEVEFVSQLGTATRATTHLLTPNQAKNRANYAMCIGYAIQYQPHAARVDFQDLQAWALGISHPLVLQPSANHLLQPSASLLAAAQQASMVSPISEPLTPSTIICPAPIRHNSWSTSNSEGLMGPRTPSKVPGGKRTSKKTPKAKNSSSSHSRPPSRAGSDVEGPAKARTLRKAKSMTFRPAEPQDVGSLPHLLPFARDLPPEAYAQMGVGYDFRSAFWKAYIEQVPYAVPLSNGPLTLDTFKSNLEKASMHFAAGYQLPKEPDGEMLEAFEAFLPTYPWNDMVVRKSDVQAAFEKSEHGQRFSSLLKRTKTKGINAYWTHFFKRFSPRWVATYPRLLQTETLNNVDKSPRKRRTSATPRKLNRQMSMPAMDQLTIQQRSFTPGPPPTPPAGTVTAPTPPTAFGHGPELAPEAVNTQSVQFEISDVPQQFGIALPEPAAATVTPQTGFDAGAEDMIQEDMYRFMNQCISQLPDVGQVADPTIVGLGFSISEWQAQSYLDQTLEPTAEAFAHTPLPVGGQQVNGLFVAPDLGAPLSDSTNSTHSEAELSMPGSWADPMSHTVAPQPEPTFEAGQVHLTEEDLDDLHHQLFPLQANTLPAAEPSITCAVVLTSDWQTESYTVEEQVEEMAPSLWVGAEDKLQPTGSFLAPPASTPPLSGSNTPGYLQPELAPAGTADGTASWMMNAYVNFDAVQSGVDLGDGYGNESSSCFLDALRDRTRLEDQFGNAEADGADGYRIDGYVTGF